MAKLFALQRLDFFLLDSTELEDLQCTVHEQWSHHRDGLGHGTFCSMMALIHLALSLFQHTFFCEFKDSLIDFLHRPDTETPAADLSTKSVTLSQCMTILQ